MLDESDGDDWVLHRHPRVRRSISSLGNVTPDGIPYLVPEIQLFYKSKSPRPKDQIDFGTALPLLSAVQRQKPTEAIAILEDRLA